MPVAKRTKGLDNVTRQLNKHVNVHIPNKTMKGLIRAAVVIRRSMDTVPPKIPVDTGNLRGSYYTNTFYTHRGPAIELGFSANYALYVHEMMGARFKRPGAGAKFLEEALKRNANEIVRIIAEEAQV